MMPINTEGSKIPFILLHGEKMNYPLSEHLGVDYPFYGFFHYGSQGEKIFHKKSNLLLRTISINYKRLSRRTIFFGGFSFGGLVAFEMAIQLQRLGFEVPVLILIDCKVPSLVEPVIAKKGLPEMSLRFYNFQKIYIIGFIIKAEVCIMNSSYYFKPTFKEKEELLYHVHLYGYSKAVQTKNSI